MYIEIDRWRLCKLPPPHTPRAPGDTAEPAATPHPHSPTGPVLETKAHKNAIVTAATVGSLRVMGRPGHMDQAGPGMQEVKEDVRGREQLMGAVALNP